MQLSKVIPSGPEFMREALIVLGGALLAALIIGQMPWAREFIKQQWDGAQK